MTTNSKPSEKTISENSSITRKDFWSVFFRSMTLDSSWNYERMQNLAYAYTMAPIIRRLYKNKEDRKDALERHLEFMSVTPHISTLLFGISGAMEEENSKNENFNPASINAVKSSLMGPLAGIGDSLFWGVWRVVCAGLAIGFANAGNILAPIIFLVLFNVPNFLCRYYGACLGYSLGAKYIEKLYANGMIEILTKAAGIVGLIMVGAMTSNTVIFKTVLEFKMKGQSLMNVQSALDSIFKGIVPLLMTFGCYKLLNKKVNVIAIIFGIVALGIVLSLLGIC